MSSEKLNIAVAQMTSVDDLSANSEKVLGLFRRAAGADLAIFPENTLFFRIRSGSSLESRSLDEMAPLRAEADKSGTALMLTTAMRTNGNKFRNSTLLFEPGRAPRVVYSKVHLFDVDVTGAPPVRESDYFENGEGPQLLDFRGWKIGLSICYDLRFSELYLNYGQAADLILVPSAFLVPTGEAHWHTLLRARAIEAQAYVAAPAQSGEHKSGDQIRRTFGHSLVVDPWGRVLADLETKEDIKTVELSREAIEKVRRQIPMKGHRRLGRV
jgi:predicted amidohydrolase